MAQEGQPLGSMIIELGMDGTKFGQSLDGIKKQMKVAQSAMKANMAVLGDAGDEYGKLGAKVDGLSNVLKVNEKQIEELRKRHKQAVDTYGEGSEQVAKLASQINMAVTKQSAWTRQLRDTEAAMKEMANESQKAASKIKGVSEALEKVKEKSNGIGEGLTKAFTAPLAAVGAFSTSVALEMDRVETRIKTMIDTTKESAKTAMNNINNITNSGRGESRESNAEAYSQTQALTGFKGRNATEFTKLALDVSTGTGYESKEVIATMNTFMKKYGMNAEEAANQLIQLKQVGIEELDETREYMPLLKDKGITPEEYAGALKEGLQAGGWSADKIQDFLKEGAIRLDSEDSKTYKEAGIGKEYKDYTSGKTNYKEFLAAVQKAMQGKSKTEQKKTWAAVSGTQGEDIDLGTITAIVNSNGLKVDSNAAKNLQKDIESMPITKFNAAWAKFKQDFEPIGDTLLKIGTDILPKVSSALSTVNSLFNNLNPTGQRTAVVIGLIAAAAGPALLAFGFMAGSIQKILSLLSIFKGRGNSTVAALNNVTDGSRRTGTAFKFLGGGVKSLASGAFNVLKSSLGVVSKSIKGVSTVVNVLAKAGLTVLKVGLKAVTLAFRGLNLAMRANPIGLVITAIQLLAVGVIYAYNHSEKFRKIVNKAFDALKKGAKVVGAFAITIKNKFFEIKDSVSKRVAELKDKVVNYMGDLKDGSIRKLNIFLDFFKKMPGKMADALARGKNGMLKAAKSLGNKMVEGIEKGVNGAIGGVNWILDKVGVDSKLKKWSAPRFAKGTGPTGHKGGLMVVGDGGESELVRTPDGKTFLSPNRDTLVNAPRGTHVFSGSQTKEILNSVPHFKNGTVGKWWEDTKNAAATSYNKVKNVANAGVTVAKAGAQKLNDIVGDVWDYASNPGKLLNIAVDKLTDLSGLKGAPLAAAKGTVSMIKDKAVGFIQNAFDMGGGSDLSSTISNRYNVYDYLYEIAQKVMSSRYGKGLVITSGHREGDTYDHGKHNAIDLSGFGSNGGYLNVAKWASKLPGVSYTIGDNTVFGKKYGNGSRPSWATGHMNHVHISGVGGTTTASGSGSDKWRSTAIKALKMTGNYNNANLSALLNQISSESGGNPRAINTWDSNALRGTPSKGLMQVIDPTFKSYAAKGYNKNIYDPLSNILAAINYTKARYGSLVSGWRGVGYANGGLVNSDQIARIAEHNKPEMIIPLQNAKRGRAIQLLNQAQRILGVTPESGTVNQNTNYEGVLSNMSEMINLLTEQNKYLAALLQKDTTVLLDPKDIFNANKKEQQKQTIINNLARGI